jgi:phosphoribulokinase
VDAVQLGKTHHAIQVNTELLGIDQSTLLPIVIILDEIQSLHRDIGNRKRNQNNVGKSVVVTADSSCRIVTP